MLFRSAGKEAFTEEEAAVYEKQSQAQDEVLRRQLGDIVWLERSHIVKTRRTSLIIDPPDGRMPPLTPEAKKRFDAAHDWARLHPADGPEDRELPERCLLFGGMGPPMLPEGYGNNYQIIQSPGYVALISEMVHDVRLIPLDARPRLPGAIRHWNGDSRGHWEGDTLVVETTNLAFNGKNRFGLLYDGWSDEHLRVTERFTRSDPDTIIYRATVDDPSVYTRPWTVEMSMTRHVKPLLEYACHEGNYGLANILSGTRAEERQTTSVPK